MQLKTVKTQNYTWYYIEDADNETIKFLKKFKFHPLDLGDVQGETQIDKIDHYKNYLFMILHFTGFDKKQEKVMSEEVVFFLGKNFLITVCKKRYLPLRNFFFRFQAGAKSQTRSFARSSGFLLYKIFDVLYRSSFKPMIENFRSRLSDLEGSVFTEEPKDDTLKKVTILRRNIINFKSIIDSQRFLITTLSHLKKDFLEDELSDYYDDVHDYLEKSFILMDNFKEMINNVQMTHEAMISQRTNEVIKILTVISVALLPLTLLAGIYGMNVTGLPFADHPLSVWGIFAIMLVIILLIIFQLKRKRWF